MYEDGTQNDDPEIHEEYLIRDTPFLLPHHLEPRADYSIAIKTTNQTEWLCCDCESKIWILKFFLTNLKKPQIWTFEVFKSFFVKKTF